MGNFFTICFFVFALFLAFSTPIRAADDDRAQRFYDGEDKQMEEKRNQDKKAAIKEIQKQQLIMQRDSTPDPGRKAQLQQQINKLQQEINDHRAQSKALKEHADKAKDAAETAESGNQKKGKETKTRENASAGDFEQSPGDFETQAVNEEGPNTSAAGGTVKLNEISDLNIDDESFEEAAKKQKQKLEELSSVAKATPSESRSGPKGLLYMDEGLEEEEREIDKLQKEVTSVVAKFEKAEERKRNRTSLKLSPPTSRLSEIAGISQSKSLEIKPKPDVPIGPGAIEPNSNSLRDDLNLDSTSALATPDLLAAHDVVSAIRVFGQTQRLAESVEENVLSEKAILSVTVVTESKRQAFILGSTREVRHHIKGSIPTATLVQASVR